MNDIKYHVITQQDKAYSKLIGEWYLSEWNIPLKTTIEKTEQLSIENHEFQILMTANNIPVATGGVYNNVGLVEKVPRLKIYKNWLALLYTCPINRGNGFGTLLGKHIQDYSKEIGLEEIYLFTHTAESLYLRLGWQQIERIVLSGKDIVVMKKVL